MKGHWFESEQGEGIYGRFGGQKGKGEMFSLISKAKVKKEWVGIPNLTLY